MKKDRIGKILEILNEHKKMDVVQLAKLCDVSQVTMRKDLDEMEEKGFVKRIHGYAEINDTDNINGRLAYHYEEKLKIAKLASTLVNDGETIFIENGSCCALLAFLLSKEKENLTIITNSAYIADYIRDNNANVILLGGIYQKDSQCLVGPMIAKMASNFHVKYFFIGTDGYSSKTGFTNKDQLRAQAVKDMAQSTDKIVVVTESEKFNRIGTIPMDLKGLPITVITDTNISKNTYQELKENNIEILIENKKNY